MSSSPSPAAQAVYWTTNSLSLLGCIAIFYVFYRSKSQTSPPLKLILLLGIFDFIFSLLNLINPLVGTADITCNILGFLKVTAGWAGLFCISMMSLFTFLTIGGYTEANFERILNKLVIGCTALAVLIALTPLVKLGDLDYTDVDAYCGVFFEPQATSGEKIAISITTRVLPYLLAVIITIAACVRSVLFFRKFTKEALKNYNMNISRLLVYPIAQIIIYTPNCLSVFALIWMDGYSEFLVVFGMACYDLGGFINFLVYGRQMLRKDALANSDGHASLQQDMSVSSSSSVDAVLGL